MQDPSIQPNPEAALQVFDAGNEKTPVIIIDDFALDTEDIVAYGRESVAFDVDRTSAYPGIRAELCKSHVVSEVNAILALLYQVYAIPTNLRPRPQSAFYSLVSTPPERLSMSQRLPHFDSNKPYYFAITHYLHDGPHGGTGLFRHLPTGFENVTDDRLDEYLEAGEQFIRSHGEPPLEYFTQSSDHYDLFQSVDYRPNRLVAYPGSMLHSGLIDPATDIDGDPATGRLTANVFVEFQ